MPDHELKYPPMDNGYDKHLNMLVQQHQEFEAIINAEICPYCKQKPELVDSSVIYGKSYGSIWYCKPCEAYVGCHKGTIKPLGRLANAELREWKKQAHFHFDKIAKTSLINKVWPVFLNGFSNRRKAYLWLANILGMSVDYCHIGMMDVNYCKRVVEICKYELLKLGIYKENKVNINFDNL